MYEDNLPRWDAAAARYEAGQKRNPFAQQNAALVRERYGSLCGKRVLDAGCGAGDYCRMFCDAGAEVTGIDGSEEMLRLAAAACPEASLMKADLEAALPLPDGAFDLVFCNQVLMDLPQFAPALQEFARVLKPGGELFVGIVHPCFYDAESLRDENDYRYAIVLRRYRTAYPLINDFGEKGWGPTYHFHRPLGDYLNAAANAGFCLTRFEEPQAYDGTVRTPEFPLFLYMTFRRL